MCVGETGIVHIQGLNFSQWIDPSQCKIGLESRTLVINDMRLTMEQIFLTNNSSLQVITL